MINDTDSACAPSQAETANAIPATQEHRKRGDKQKLFREHFTLKMCIQLPNSQWAIDANQESEVSQSDQGGTTRMVRGVNFIQSIRRSPP